jgi:hypothetical protein
MHLVLLRNKPSHFLETVTGLASIVDKVLDGGMKMKPLLVLFARCKECNAWRSGDL